MQILILATPFDPGRGSNSAKVDFSWVVRSISRPSISYERQRHGYCSHNLKSNSKSNNKAGQMDQI